MENRASGLLRRQSSLSSRQRLKRRKTSLAARSAISPMPSTPCDPESPKAEWFFWALAARSMARSILF
jgi:hypothetical protein